MEKTKDVADAKRYEDKYENERLYTVIVPEEREAFISSVKQDVNPNVRALTDCLSRMISLAWSHASTEEVLEQLFKSSGSTKDIPGIIHRRIQEALGIDDNNVRSSETD